MGMQVSEYAEAPENGSDRPPEEYDRMIGDLEAARGEILDKIENGRIRDASKDRTRAKYLRTVGYLVRSQLKVVEQREIADLKERVERLEGEIEQSDHSGQ